MRSTLVDLAALRRRLGARPPERVFRWLPARRAAVAVILDEERRVLLMRRAERAGDRWSSQVALPGGMAQDGDWSLLATAARETREEVGVDVDGMERIGALDEVRAIANGGLRPMSVAPFVFAAHAPLAPRIGPEVASVFWLPLELAAAGALDDRLFHPVGRVTIPFPCWRFEGHVVWGLTYGVLQRVLRLTQPR